MCEITPSPTTFQVALQVHELSWKPKKSKFVLKKKEKKNSKKKKIVVMVIIMFSGTPREHQVSYGHDQNYTIISHISIAAAPPKQNGRFR